MKKFNRPGDFAEPSAFVGNEAPLRAQAAATEKPPANQSNNAYRNKVNPMTGSVKESIIFPAKLRSDIQRVQDEESQDFANAARSLILDGFKYRALIQTKVAQ